MEDAKTLARDLASLVSGGQSGISSLAANSGEPLAAPIARARINAATGIGVMKGAPSSGGGGVDFPLTEASYAARTWYDNREISTTDGIFTFIVADLHTVTLTDASGASGNIEFADPLA